jgi:hypothetical protein
MVQGEALYPVTLQEKNITVAANKNSDRNTMELSKNVAMYNQISRIIVDNVLITAPTRV